MKEGLFFLFMDFEKEIIYSVQNEIIRNTKTPIQHDFILLIKVLKLYFVFLHSFSSNLHECNRKNTICKRKNGFFF